MYSEQKKLDGARLFVRNNPDDCRGVDPAPLPGHVDENYHADTPTSTRVSEVMLEICRLSQPGE